MTSPPALPFDQLGGEEGIRRLVDRFYDLMDTSPEAVNVRALHAASLKRSREKLYMYLTGWTGGPPLYENQYGHPRLRMRHMGFAVTPAARDAWLTHMLAAVDTLDLEPDDEAMLREYLTRAAYSLVNRAE